MVGEAWYRMVEFPRVMLLDLDDTIIVHSATSEPCWRRVCNRYAANFEDLSANQLYDAIQSRSSKYWGDANRHRQGRLDLPLARREVVAATFSDLGWDDQELAYKIADAFTLERNESFYPCPGAIETLGYFQEQGIRMGMVTNGASSAQRAKIDRFELAGFFEHIFIEGEMGMGKPDTRVFRHVLDTFAIAAEDVWMVGDNLTWDVEAPQALGIFSVWIDLKGNGTPLSSTVKPDLIVPSLAALRDA
jgi:putative hydrolase of the HAD superfamily